MQQIYVHGLGQTPDSWDNVLSYLDADKHSICPDLSELIKGQDTTYQNLYSAFSEICNLADDTLALCGLSLGGVLALNYVIEHPKKVEKLVLISAQYKMPKKLLKLQNTIFHLMPKFMFNQTGFNKHDFLRLCNTMIELDFSQSLQKVSSPTMVVCGEKDRANEAASTKLAELLNNATLQIISNTGHEVNIEAPKDLADILNNFYKS